MLATGSKWDPKGLSAYRPDRDAIPGWERDHVLDLGAATGRALEDPLALGRRVLMIDESESYPPLALAQLLAESGVAVEIVSPRAIYCTHGPRSFVDHLRELGHDARVGP